MSTFAEVARKLDKVADSLDNPRALHAAGGAAKQEMRRGASGSDTGGDGRLSGYGRGARRGTVEAQARYDLSPGERIIVTPTRKSSGLWALLQFGSRSTTWKRPRRRGARSAGTYTRAAVRARKTWSQQTPEAARATMRAYQRAIAQGIARAMRG